MPASPTIAANPWEHLAQAYADSRQVSADKLIEWPAQLRLAGDFTGQRILDAGCGTGEKARYFAEHGASSVIGLDPSTSFAEHWQQHRACPNLELLRAGFDDLATLPQLQHTRFDLIVCFQALMYAADLPATVARLACLLVPGGILTVSVPHPFRFAILRHELDGTPHGAAYADTAPYRYPSPWKPEILLEHAMPRIADYLNAFAAAGLELLACEEPPPTPEFRAVSPEKAAWMDRYVGIIVFRTRLSPR